MDETALRKSANEYIKWETNESCRAEIKKLLAQGDLSTLEKRLSAHLEFGTAGLRGPMVAGYNALNELTVVQATQGLALYLEETFGAALSEGGGVALAHDHCSVAARVRHPATGPFRNARLGLSMRSPRLSLMKLIELRPFRE